MIQAPKETSTPALSDYVVRNDVWIASCLPWDVAIHTPQTGYESRRHKDKTENLPQFFLFIFDSKIQMSLIKSNKCLFNSVIKMLDSSKQVLNEDELIQIFSLLAVYLFHRHQECLLLFQIVLKVCNLILHVKYLSDVQLSINHRMTENLFFYNFGFIDQQVCAWNHLK